MNGWSYRFNRLSVAVWKAAGCPPCLFGSCSETSSEVSKYFERFRPPRQTARRGSGSRDQQVPVNCRTWAPVGTRRGQGSAALSSFSRHHQAGSVLCGFRPMLHGKPRSTGSPPPNTPLWWHTSYRRLEGDTTMNPCPHHPARLTITPYLFGSFLSFLDASFATGGVIQFPSQDRSLSSRTARHCSPYNQPVHCISELGLF